MQAINKVRPFFLKKIFCSGQNSRERFWVVQYSGIFGLGGPGTLGHPPCPSHVGVEFLNVGGWFTHGDLALEVGVDFLAVA